MTQSEIDARLAEAVGLEERGEAGAAREAYLAILALDPTHRATLARLGTLLHLTGYKRAARRVFTQAVTHHPGDPAAHVLLANALLDDDQSADARAHYERAIALAPDAVAAHRGLAILLLRAGDELGARRHGARGFRTIPVAPYRGEGAGTDVLLLVSALGGNIATDEYLDDRTFRVATLVAEFDDPAIALPPHALVFNAVGDADRGALALDRVQRVLRRTAAPAINRPEHVRATARERNAERLAQIPDVVTPRTRRYRKGALLGPGAAMGLQRDGFGWPLLLRTPGFHTGAHFERVDDAAALARTVAALPGEELLAMEFLDLREGDGCIRKYRAMIVGGVLYPLHLAVARVWKVHFFSADMAEHAAHRAEDARFLTDMAGVLGPRASEALERVAARLGLDYGGIDFGLDRAGRVVIFEANATMVVPFPDADPRWDYRHEPVKRIRAAVRAMLLARALKR